MNDAELAQVLWDAANALGEATIAIETRARDCDWARKYGDKADEVLLPEPSIRMALRTLATAHDRAILARNQATA